MTTRKRGKQVSIAYLGLTDKQAEASDALNFAVDRSVEGGSGLPFCYDNPEPYMDFDERLVPLPEEAEALCAGCPVFAACDSFAKAIRPPVGVWAGKTWVDGSIQK